MSIVDRQYDPPLLDQFNRTLPKNVKGRLTRDDFITFNYDTSFPFQKYDVCVQTFNGEIRKFSPLLPSVQLPGVQFVNDSLLLVLPKHDRQAPRFAGIIQRGQNYNISQEQHVNGFFILK